MSGLNYCLIKKNKIYESIQDLMDLEELSMNNPNHNEKVFDKISNLVKKSRFIEFRGNENDTNSLLENIMLSITDENKSKNIQGNTLLLYGNDEEYYEVIYMENLIEKNKNNDDLNEFASISNTSLEPIFGDCVIVKTCLEKDKHVPKIITVENICEILINNFYHKGIIINTDGTTKELIYSGDSPLPVVGGKFKRSGEINVLGLILVPWIEDGQEVNQIATKLFGSEIKGRIFLTILSPVTSKRYWSISITNLNSILSILEDKEKTNQISNEIIESNYTINPFFLIKKYCI